MVEILQGSSSTWVACALEPWFNSSVEKQKAIELLGGSVVSAARAMGVSYQAVDKWPDILPARIAERVMGVYAKDRLPELAEKSAIWPELSRPKQKKEGAGNV